MNATLQQNKLIRNGIEWTASKSIVCDCAKCAGSGKYYYADRSVGQCYTCLGLGLTIEGEHGKPRLEKHQKEIAAINWNEDKQQVTIWYICKDNIGDITPWEKVANLATCSEEGKEFLRGLWRLAPRKTKHTAM
jgi:hypothetical protein